jgi:hypothetical protein
MSKVMGMRMAPFYVNLFMGSLEEDFLKSDSYRIRYITDIFLSCTQGNDSLLLSLEYLIMHYL